MKRRSNRLIHDLNRLLSPVLDPAFAITLAILGAYLLAAFWDRSTMP